MSPIANIYDFESVLLEPSEKIDKKAIKNYIFTSLTLGNTDIENKRVFYTYLYFSNSIQVFITETKYDTFVFEYLEPLLSTSHKTTILICDEFFAVFYKAQFYYYKKLNTQIKQEDIEEFVSKKLSLTDISIQVVDEKRLNELLNKKQKIKSSIKRISKSSKGLYSYLVYLLLVFFVFTGYIFYKNSEIKKQNIKIEKQQQERVFAMKKSIKYTFMKPFLKRVITNIKKNRIKIDSIIYENKTLKFRLLSATKADINQFVLQSKDFIKLNTIRKDLEEGYTFDGIIRFTK